nr:replication factor A protein 1-like [Ipomoea batatas]
MYPLYIVTRELSLMNTRSAIRLRFVREYEVPERKGSSSIKFIEVFFHDQEGTFLHAHIPKEHVEKFLNWFKEGRVYGLRVSCRLVELEFTHPSPVSLRINAEICRTTMPKSTKLRV